MSALLTPAAMPLANMGMGESASTMAENVDSIYSMITWISLFFFVLIVGLMALFLFQYRARPGHKEQPSPSHNNALEIMWSVIPTLLVALIFFISFIAYVDMRTPPDDAYDIQVIASKWKFIFRYPNGAEDEILYVPKDRPIRLVQQSQDVLHSLYIPAFRTKMDCVPGRYTYQWFNATKAGTYDLFCTEYCGLDHSNMNSYVKVFESEAEFEKKLADLGEHSPHYPTWGKEIWEKKGCKQCHSDDGSVRSGGGPSWLDLFNPDKQPKQFTNADPVVADHNYVKESIRKPQAKIRAGYAGVNMSAYPPSIVSDEEIDALIAFMESLAGEYDGPTEEEAIAAAKAAKEAEAAGDEGMGDETEAIESTEEEPSEPADESEEEPAAPEAGE